MNDKIPTLTFEPFDEEIVTEEGLMVKEERSVKEEAFDESSLSDVLLTSSDMSHADISRCKLKNLKMDDSRFVNTSFFKTSLNKIDFTESHIVAINVSNQYTELRGMIVNTFQAADLTALLGVIIK